MAWLKVDDQFFSNPKAVKAFTTNPAALGVWVMCATWCANQMTDGHVPGHLVRMWGISDDLIGVLVDSGLWTVNPVEDGWVMHDFLDYNPSRAELVEKREKEAARRAQRGSTNGTRTQQRGASVNGPVPVPVPDTSPKGDVYGGKGISAKEKRTRQRLGLVGPEGGNAA